MVKAKKECVRVGSGTCQATPGRVRDQAEPARQAQNWCHQVLSDMTRKMKGRIFASDLQNDEKHLYFLFPQE